ncbi:MAG: hypothetical protein PVG65_01330 [Candidatus Thorarchaeota archaeon]|jgi:hypothetical protein
MQDVAAALIRLDLLLETISGIIALLISHYSNQAFKLTRQKRLADLSTGFLVLSAGMFGRVIGTLYFFVLLGIAGIPTTQTLFGVVTVAYGVMRVMAYILFAISTRHVREQPAMETWLLALPVLIQPHLEIIAIIVLIIVVLQALMNYVSNRSSFALYVLAGFFLLLLSHITAMFSQVELRGWILSQIFQFLGFVALLVMLIKAGRDE